MQGTQKKGDPRIYLEMTVDGHKSIANIDPGSDKTLISTHWTNAHPGIGLLERRIPMPVELGDQSLVEEPIRYQTEKVQLIVNNMTEELQIDVVNMQQPDLTIGIDFLE